MLTVGVPDNKFGNNGWLAVDTDTGAVYVKSAGTWGALTSPGGSGSNSIDYSGPPILNPPDVSSIVVDSDGRQWMYWGGAWH